MITNIETYIATLKKEKGKYNEKSKSLALIIPFV